MMLPLKPPVLPQLSRSAKTLPLGDGWSYEPKSDGFRAIAFVDGDGRQDFDALGERIHPAESRIRMLAEKTPTRFIAFDVLADGEEVLLTLPQSERRARLEALVGDPVELTPSTTDAEAAQEWLQSAEGVVAKELGEPYRPGERKGMVK